MVVNEGATADQTLSISDPDNGTYTFSLVSGPSFATVTTTSDSTGNVHLAPSFTDAGSHRTTVSATDGALADEKSFQITVNDVNFPPVLAQPADMHAVPGTITDQTLIASDPDGQALTFLKVSGPSFVYVGQGYVRLIPSSANVGSTTATVAVTDGGLSDQKSFAIQVDNANSDPVLTAPEDMILNEGADLDQTVVAIDPDGQALSFSAWTVPRFMSVTTLPQSPGSTSAFGRVRLMSAYADAGTYTPTLVLSDGRYQDTKAFNVTVRDAYPGEMSLRLSDTPAGEVPDPVNEYSAIDGNYSAFLLPGGNFLAFDFRESSGHGAWWRVEIKAPNGLPLVEGRYENVLIGDDWTGRALRIFGSDPDLPSLAGCSQGIANFTVERIVRRIDGSLLSFWATFDQTCSEPPLIGPGPTLSVLVAPNPLNPVGTLSFVTRQSGTARLRLFDIRGRLVRTLLNTAFLGSGYHDVVIDGRGEGGAQLSSGIYLYRLETAEIAIISRALFARHP